MSFVGRYTNHYAKEIRVPSIFYPLFSEPVHNPPLDRDCTSFQWDSTVHWFYTANVELYFLKGKSGVALITFNYYNYISIYICIRYTVN